MSHRLLLTLLLLAGVALATATAESVPDDTFTSRYTGRTYAVHRDGPAGTKCFRGPDGREFSSIRELLSAELSAIGDPKARIDPSLWPAVYAESPDPSPRELVLVLAEQPLQRCGGTPPAGGRKNVRAWREWVLAETSRRAAVIRAPVLERLAGHRVVGSSDLVNAIFLVAAPADLPEILSDNPEIWIVQPAGRSELTLDVAVPTSSASSFWTGGYDGTGVTVGVIDTGMDNQHPALKAAITSEKVFLSWGKSDWYFADDATSTDDKHGHGTHCAGIVASRDTTYTGVAKKASLVNAKAGYQTTDGLGGLHDYDIIAATHWCSTRVDILSLSFGGPGSSGNDPLAQLFDAAVHGLGIHVAVAAGNDGPTSRTINSPGDAFNVVTVGATNDKGTKSVSDDAIASFSSRGPTIDKRRKPTISAPGYDIYSAAYDWEGSASDFTNKDGTSMACPHVAGALALLMDYQNTWKPQSMKALLVNSSRNSSPYPTYPNDTWGWGGLDLGQAYLDRASVHEDSFSSTGKASIYYLASSSLPTGSRATLVWNRQVTFPSSGTPGTPPSLLDLDLYLYDGATGQLRAKSDSTVNPVEQVRASSSVSSPVLRVLRSGTFPTGSNSFTKQPYSLATSSAFSLAKPPDLVLTVTPPADPVTAGASFAVTVTVENLGDLPALTPTLSLTTPGGFTLTGGNQTTPLTTIKSGASTDVVFKFTAPYISTVGTISASASSTCFGATFTGGPATGDAVVDSVPPSGDIIIEGNDPYTCKKVVILTLLATDAHSGVSSVRLAEGSDAWGDWQAFTVHPTIPLSTGDGEKTVRAQFRDRAGNLSTVVSDTIVLDTTRPIGSVRFIGGVQFTNATRVPIALSASDADSGVDGFRIRVAGGAWTEWEAMAGTGEVLLSGPDGAKKIEIVFKDRAGNQSDASVLSLVFDRTRPTVALAIEDGAAAVNRTRVTVRVDADDNLSGVESMHVSSAISGAWIPVAPTATVDLYVGEGPRQVRARVRDRAGNTSTEAEDWIRLDVTPPTGTFQINGGAPYVLPEEPLKIAIDAEDGLGGSGLVGARFRFDAGWSEPYDLRNPATLEILDDDRPVAGGFINAGMVLLDDAGNESDPIEVPVMAIAPSPPPARRKVAGTLDFPEHVEALAVNLVQGDTLSVKLKYKAMERWDFADVGLDLVRPDGRRLIRDKYPSTLPRAGIKNYTAKETGRYFILIYRSGGSDTSKWKVSTKVRQAKENKVWKDETTLVRFEAVNGSKLKGTLQAPGLTAEGIRLVGPNGENSFTFKEKNGKVTIKATVLDAGTGSYEFVIDNPAGGEPLGPIKHKLTCARPKS